MHDITSTNVRSGKLSLRTLFFFVIILLVAIGITWWFTRIYYDNSKATDNAFQRLDSSLNISSKFLMQACMEDSSYVYSKARQPGYSKIKDLYMPKIDSVMRSTREMHAYIQSIKQSFNPSIDLMENNGRSNHSKQKEKENWNYEIAKSLYDSLQSYSKLLRTILQHKMYQYNAIAPIDTSNPHSKNAEIWIKTHFEDLTKPAILSSITELDYQVWLSANRMTEIIRSQWCDILQINDNIRYFLTSQNSNYFLPGQTLEISAGLGAYVTNIKPQIFIDGQKQVVGKEGYAIFKKLITKGKGEFIPISISYKNPNTGEIMTMSKQLSYTVFQPKK